MASFVGKRTRAVGSGLLAFILGASICVPSALLGGVQSADAVEVSYAQGNTTIADISNSGQNIVDSPELVSDGNVYISPDVSINKGIMTLLNDTEDSGLSDYYLLGFKAGFQDTEDGWLKCDTTSNDGTIRVDNGVKTSQPEEFDLKIVPLDDEYSDLPQQELYTKVKDAAVMGQGDPDLLFPYVAVSRDGLPVLVPSVNALEGTKTTGTLFAPGDVVVPGMDEQFFQSEEQSYDVKFHAYDYNPDLWGDVQNEHRDGTEIDVPEGAVAVPGVSYKLYRLDTADGIPADTDAVVSEPGKWGLTDDDIAGSADADVVAGPTDDQGIADVSVSEGVYYVVPVEPDGTSRITEPFIFKAPMTSPDGSGYLDTIHIYPKTSSGPTIEKSIVVNDEEYTAAGVNVGDTVNYRLEVVLPDDLYAMIDTNDDKINDTEAYAQSVIVEDAFDTTMLDPDTVGFTIEGLVADTDYTNLSSTSGTTETLKIQLTQSGMKKLAQSAPGAADHPTMVVNVSAVVQSGAISVDYVNNTASVDYSSRLGTEFDKDSNTVEVHTGSAAFTKVDGITGADLAGATFGIAASQEDAEAGDFIATATSGEDGVIRFDGLTYGALGDGYETASSTYYVVETDAPDGYELLPDPVQITVNYQSDDLGTIEATKIANNPSYILPMTGGIGAAMFLVIGIAVFAAAAGIRAHRARKNMLLD